MTQFGKRILTLLLSLFMLAPLLPSAHAAQGDAVLSATDPDDPQRYSKRPLNLCVMNDTLYFQRGDSIYSYQPGDSEEKLYLSNLSVQGNENASSSDEYWYDFLYAEDDHFIAVTLERAGQAVAFTLRADAEGKPVYGEKVALDVEDLLQEDGDYNYLNYYFECSAVIDHVLYLCGGDYNDSSAIMFAFDLESGERTDYEGLDIQLVAPYQDGKLLCMVMNEMDAWDPETGEPKPLLLCALDPETEEMEEVASISGINHWQMTGLLYDESTDTIYYALANRIYRIQGQGEAELCAYHPADIYPQAEPHAALLGDTYVLATNDGIYLRGTDPAELPTQTLSIYGSFASKQHLKAAAAIQDTPVFFQENTYYSTAQELGQALTSGDTQFDLLSINMNAIEFDRLMEKGYCMDLSGSEKLTAYVSQLYPFLQDAVTMDGGLYAIPYNMHGYGFGYDAQAMEALGYTQEQIPDNYLDLMSFVSAWNDPDNAEKWEEYALLEYEGEYASPFFYDILEAVDHYYATSGQPMKLDDPIFRSLMEAWQSMETDNIELHVDWGMEDEVPEEIQELWDKTMLFSTYQNYSTERPYNHHTMCPLKLTPDTEPVVPMYVEVFFVNPNSENLDACIRYLEAYVEAIEPLMLADMCPDMNEPQENSYYASNVENMQKVLKNLEKSLSEADEADKQALQDDLDSYKEYVEDYIATERYVSTKETIAAYRALMEHACVAKPSILYQNTGDDSFLTLRQRFLDQQITLDQFIQEGDSKLRLMQLENQ